MPNSIKITASGLMQLRDKIEHILVIAPNLRPEMAKKA
jgi:hypothetical protein